MIPGAVVVLGGSGFVGRHIVSRLAAAGMTVVVPARRRERAKHLILLPTVHVIEANIHEPSMLPRLLKGAAAVINLVGILNETKRGDFRRAHVDLARAVVSACRESTVPRLLQMSALNADPAGPSEYLRTKGEAEAIVAGSGLAWTIFEPSVIFGPEDSFLNLFAKLQRYLPLLPLACPNARFQPVFVGDVARGFVQSLFMEATFGKRYPLCGPSICALKDLVRYVGVLTRDARPIIALSPRLSRWQAALFEHLPGGLMSRDNVLSMQQDNVCNCDFPSVFAWPPASLETVAPGYLGQRAERDRFARYRSHSGR